MGTVPELPRCGDGLIYPEPVPTPTGSNSIPFENALGSSQNQNQDTTRGWPMVARAMDVARAPRPPGHKHPTHRLIDFAFICDLPLTSLLRERDASATASESRMSHRGLHFN